jgi:NlpC/P60 family putative phage cell wall peptidase
MTRNTDIVREARRWLGTPYQHQASRLGAGADCLGLVRGVWRNLIGTEPEIVPPYTDDWSEPSGFELLNEAACRWLTPVELGSVLSGEVLLFRMREGCVAKHLAISASRDGEPTFIHAYTSHGVVETHLSAPWQRRIIARFRFPTGEY